MKTLQQLQQDYKLSKLFPTQKTILNNLENLLISFEAENKATNLSELKIRLESFSNLKEINNFAVAKNLEIKNHSYTKSENLIFNCYLSNVEDFENFIQFENSAFKIKVKYNSKKDKTTFIVTN